MENILLVDDNSQNLYFLEVLLKGNGFETRTALNGVEALASARANPPDLIIADILMPVMDGFALCREWRADERLRHIPFIFYTATFTEKKDEELAISLGGDRFLVKPQEPEVLMSVIRELLSASRTGAAGYPTGSFHSEAELLRGYNEALVRKLEKKMIDLEQAHQQEKLASMRLQRLNDELEERVQQRTRELEDKVAELNDFTSAVSHDLRAPMRQLRSYSQILLENLEGRLDDENTRILQKIDQKSAAAIEMVDTLLELSRLGNTEVVRQEVDLSGLALAIVNELSAAEPGRRHQFTVAAGLRVQADQQLVRIVLANLLDNAWKYCANRQETRISLTETVRDNAVAFCISDNGAGFDMQHADRLFVPFQRLHSHAEFAGIGIGLATVSSIVRRHGGRIWAESEPDKGASFYFTLGDDQDGKTGPIG